LSRDHLFHTEKQRKPTYIKQQRLFLENEMEVKSGSDYKRLYRSEDDRILAGVCSGIGDYFRIDPVLIRVIWVIGSLMWGGGILIYLLAWILIPKQPLDFS